jgi:hypothetical protein
VLRDLRPDAVGLVDAFAIPDYVLDSSLGRFDGDVYRLTFFNDERCWKSITACYPGGLSMMPRVLPEGLIHHVCY